jgi:hypothetical protein
MRRNEGASLLSLLVCLLGAVQAQAEEWKFLGSSQLGKHYVDRDSLHWDDNQSTFSIVTNVIQSDKSAWLTVIEIDCHQNTFTYTHGIKMQDKNVLSKFDTPRRTEPINPESMPDKLRRQYCDADSNSAPAEWESIGKSNIAEVFFDRTSVKQSQDGDSFMAETKVVPLDNQEPTFSRILFNCSDKTFTLLRLSKLKNGKMEHVFNKPQPPTATSKTATLETLADKFCVTPTK